MAEPYIGEIRLFAFSRIPNGWMPCNGQLLEIEKHQALYTVIGSRFGGDGNKTFALPNLQGRVPLGSGPEDPLGKVGGEVAHVLTIKEMPAHSHEAVGGSDVEKSIAAGLTWGTPQEKSGVTPYKSNSNTTMHAAALESAGGNRGHDNMQPYLALCFCIAIEGYYPPKPSK